MTPVIAFLLVVAFILGAAFVGMIIALVLHAKQLDAADAPGGPAPARTSFVRVDR